MTNWKFSAFFAITLMLIAGLFSTAAMAADGDGAMTDYSTLAPRPTRNNLEADSIMDMTFTYTITDGEDSKMNGGLLQMVIPDWMGRSLLMMLLAVTNTENTVV